MNTYKRIAMQWLIFKDPMWQTCHHFFFTYIAKFRGAVWYSIQLVSPNVLAGMTKRLCDGIASLKEKNTTNRIERNNGISRLDEANVPLDKAIELTGHCNQESIKKHCRAVVEVTNRVM